MTTTANPNFWQERTFIVTGGAGFAGSYVVKKLKERAAKEIIVPRSHTYDLRDLNAVQHLLNLPENPAKTIVIHLAATVGGIGANREHPAEYFYNNLMMGVQLFHKTYEMGFEKFVGIGTICAYPKLSPIPFREEDLWNGYPEETNAPYGLAKKMLLVQSQAYQQQYGFNSLFLLPVNLYGPGDNFNPHSSHVIPALIKKCVDAIESGDDHIVVWGDGTPTREFLYVADAAEGILLATERYNHTDPINLGSAFEISIHDLVTCIVKETGFNGRIIWDTSKPNGQPRRKLDTTKAKEAFGFQAEVDFITGLRHTINWYRQERQKGHVQ